MNKWIIIPNKKVGDIEFGMKRKIVREVIGEEYKEFKKNIFSKNTTDDYGEFHVYYNGSECEAVEIFEGEVVYKGFNIMKLNLQKIKELFEDLKEDGENYYLSQKYSIGITMDGNKIDAILLGEKDYYI